MNKKFIPLDRMWQRVNSAKLDSDHGYFDALMLGGELLIKLTTLGFIGSIRDHQERPRYRQLHKLVRADGIGSWTEALTEVLSGPTSQHTVNEVREARQQVTQKLPPGNWQYDATQQLHLALTGLNIDRQPCPSKTSALRAFELLTFLRNKTRGHGAKLSSDLARVTPYIAESLRLISENLPLLAFEWAYLRRNLNGKYRVEVLTETGHSFEKFRRENVHCLVDGIYIQLDEPRLVELFKTDPDLRDFFVPNGGYSDRKFELVSYITGDTEVADATPYLGPATPLPPSETEGPGELVVRGKLFSSVPDSPQEYIARAGLERELKQTLENDRHPVVTLAGRGGIGKTSLALKVLNELSASSRFETMVWFSARDIDLKIEGPKPVRPKVLAIEDVAKDFARMVDRPDEKQPLELLGKSLTSPEYGPTLFVFDNFETMTHPQECFEWLDQYVRNPNKVLITTRTRAFKADYPIEVLGMTEQEADRLVSAVAQSLGITELLDRAYVEKIIEESNGHPYVIKILLGEVARQKRRLDLTQVVRGQREVLDALFDRVYESLSPLGKRVFLTLSSWNSSVATVALQAVLARPENAAMPVDEAVGELKMTSFIEVHTVGGGEDDPTYISVPLAASLFGRSKLIASEYRAAVEADVELLKQFGAARSLDKAEDLQRHVLTYIRAVARKMDQLERHLPVLTYIAGQLPRVWLDIAQLYIESDHPDRNRKARDALKRYLEAAIGERCVDVWVQLSELCRNDRDAQGELNALTGAAEQEHSPIHVISNAANRFNSILASTEYSALPEKAAIQTLTKRLIAVMINRRAEMDASAHSRLAWLFLRIGDPEAARHEVTLGLKKWPDNEYCLKLAAKFAAEDRLMA